MELSLTPTPAKSGFLVAVLGLISFIFGIVAELKKAYGTPTKGEGGVIICKYPFDPFLLCGYFSTVLLAITSVAGYCSLFYPYKGKAVPRTAIFRSRWCYSYICVALVSTVWALAFLLWPTIEGNLHQINNVHKDLIHECPTAKSGLIGGAAFLSLNSTLFWLVCLMLAVNARDDYFEDKEYELI